jgi:putative polyhydroxyalkanoate system protein
MHRPGRRRCVLPRAHGRPACPAAMPDIHIHRPHALGLDRAREIAWRWAEEVERKFDMACTVIEGETSDTVEFVRTGVKGTLIVAPDHFELDAKLGFLLGAFARTIEQQIEHNLDDLLAAESAAAKPARKTTPRQRR